MRKRHVVVAATGLVAAALTGCSAGGSSEAQPSAGSSSDVGQPGSSASPTAKPPSGDPPVRVTPSNKPKPPKGKPTKVGDVVLRLPKGWHVHSGPGKDSHYVTTGGCDRASLHCPGFRVMGSAQIKKGHEGKAYKSGSPFYPSSDTQRCPSSAKLKQKLPDHPKASGYGEVGKRRAIYHQWTISCVAKAKKGKKPKVKSVFYQWEWYLPQSKLLIVDQWSTSSLGTILKWAKTP